MGASKKRGCKRELVYLLAMCILPSLLVMPATGNVMLIGRNVTLSFDDVEAKFAPTVKGSGICGILYLAEPLDACTPLTNEVDPVEKGLYSSFALIVRGGCTFDDKVRRAQEAGFKAAIVYDHEDDGLVAMAGNAAGIKINAVFVSRASGEVLKKYAGFTDMELWIIPTFENSAWSIMAISFVSLLAMSAVLATCFFVRRHRIRRERPQAPLVREFHGMSSHLVKAMPSLIFTAVLEDNSTSTTCAICLEDYRIGEKLRILPCCHKFHVVCVDSWLTTWRTFCPVCKRDARTSTGNPPASESTPLLSSGPVSISSPAAGMSSVRSSLSSSAAIQIAPSSSWTPSVSNARSFSSTPYVPQYLRSHGNSPAFILSRSSADLRNASSQRSHASHLVSPHSMGYPSVSPLNSRYMSPFFPSSSNASPSYLGSSSRQPPYLLHSPALALSRSSADLRNASSQRSHASHIVSPHSLGYPSLSPLNSRYMSPFVPSSSNASPSYLGSSSRQQTYLLHCSESAASFSPYDSAQSLPGC